MPKHEPVYVGPEMTGLQYEALCRHAIARIYGVPIDTIYSGHVSGPCQQRQELRHQIDLYWDISDEVCSYRVFADAKWRTRRVQLGDLMEVVGVWRDIGFHKAMMITNSGFDVGVVKQARAKGIALLVVRPAVDLSGLGTTKINAVVGEVEAIARGREEAVFVHKVVHKTFGGAGSRQRAVGREGRGDAETRGRGEPVGNLNDEIRNSNQIRNLDNETGDEGGGAREGGTVASGAGEEEGARGRGVDGEIAEGGIWLIGGGGGDDGSAGMEDKAIGRGEIPNKMMEGGELRNSDFGSRIWKKG